MTLAIGDVVQTRVVVTMQSQISVNVLHYLVATTAGLGPTEQDVATALDTLVAPKYKPLLSAVASYYGVGAKRIKPTQTAEASVTGSFGAGTLAGDPLPKQVSGLITKKTALAGPANRGRVYVPFPSEGVNDAAGIPTTAYLTNLIVLAAALNATLTAGTIPNTGQLIPVIYHRLAGTTQPVLLTLHKPRWATQRRRGDFGRLNAPPF